VIIRVLHRGQGRVARRLVGFVGASDAPLERGEPLSIDGKETGRITSAVLSPALRRPIGLGYVRRDHSEPGTVLDVISADGPSRTVTVVTIPFTQPASR
jgi:glycine cleavage system aminomethyltransferase T